MKKIIWRLTERPTSDSLRELVASGILTKDEAREVLFSLETTEDRDKKSLEEEIRFLRKLVETLSQFNHSRIVEVIREVEKPYNKYNWWPAYGQWMGGAGGGGAGGSGGISGGTVFNYLATADSIATLNGSVTTGASINTEGPDAFSSIKTF